jgi:dephospho-CoA kinase
LGRIVFADASALAELNALTHRFVVEEIRRRLRAHAMNGGTLAAIDAVELHASGLDGLCARTYAVLAPREQRIRRIMARDGISEEAAVRRLNAQKGDDYYVNTCDIALLNDGDEAAFAALCREKLMEDHIDG